MFRNDGSLSPYLACDPIPTQSSSLPTRTVSTGTSEERTTVALGTDNVMLNSPSMFREMAFAAKLSDMPAREVLRMATRAGAEIAGLDCGVIEAGRPAKLVVLDGNSDNLAGAKSPVRAVVRRAGAANVKRVLL